MTRPASNGSIIGATQEPTPTSAGGIWTLPAQLELQKQGKWIAPGYNISRSLRFDSARSNYLSRTPASAGNRKTWTWSGWVKRSSFSRTADLMLFACRPSGYTLFSVRHANSAAPDSILFEDNNGMSLVTTAKYRDPSAWYHIVLAVDTTQATASNRVKLYINGSQVTAFSTETYPSQNLDMQINSANAHGVGGYSFNTNEVFDGYMADVHFIDGQALDPSYFGVVDNLTGVWRPKQVEDMNYGTNGFYLPFSDNTSTTTLGYDQSGNANNWTLSAGFSVTAGAGNDSLVDSPTQYGTDTGAGGEVRGNYCTLNPLYKPSGVDNTSAISNGNLQFVTDGNTGNYQATFSVLTGKWYWEILVSDAGTSSLVPEFGIQQTGSFVRRVNGINYISTGNKNVNNSTSAYGATFTTNDVIGVALDMDAGEVTFYKNNSSQGALALSTASIVGAVSPVFVSGGGISCTLNCNFGQRPFAYTAPSGFKALCTTNLPDPTVVQGGDYFNTVLWTGNGASTINITGVGFQPDFVWAKRRSGVDGHGLFDAVRGTNLWLQSNTTGAETTFGGSFGLLSFNADGYTMGNGTSVNQSGESYVGWNWKANGAGVSNTDGSITSTVSANTTAGISIVTYTGNGTSGATVGHGLGVAPSMVIIKQRTVADSGNLYNWNSYHIGLDATAPEDYFIALNTTAARIAYTTADLWSRTKPSSTVVTLAGSGGSGTNINNYSGTTYVAYCFAEVEGFSKFGSYTGNGSADGPFIYTGFRPAFVLIKSSSTGGSNYNWFVYDSVRDTYNVANKYFEANLSSAEQTSNTLDLLSNGFKLRTTSTYVGNGSGITYIYAAFAENPFKNALAR